MGDREQRQCATGAAVVLFVLASAAPLAAQELPPGSPRPLSLEAALDLAEVSSEEVVIAAAGATRARGEQLRARSDYFPQITASATYTRTFASEFSGVGGGGERPDTAAGPSPERCGPFGPDTTAALAERVDTLEQVVRCLSSARPAAGLEGLFGDLPFGTPHRYDALLSLSQIVFTGGRVAGQAQAAAAGRRSAEIELTAARAQLVLDVTEAYFDAVLATRLLVIAQSAFDQAERTLEVTQAAVAVGRQAEFDALRARVSRDNQRSVVIQRGAERDIAFTRLKLLLDVPVDEVVALTTGLGDALPAPVAARAPAPPGPDTATALRAPVRQAAESVRSAEAGVRIARAQRIPDVTLTSQYGRVAFPSEAFPVLEDFRATFFVALNVEVPLFLGGRIRGDALVAEADLREARARLEQVSEAAVLDARSTIEQLAAAGAVLEATTATIEEAARAYEIAQLRYREGVSSLIELNDTRIQLEQARANRARAARDLVVARTRLALLPDLPLQAPALPGDAVVLPEPTSPAIQAPVQPGVPARTPAESRTPARPTTRLPLPGGAGGG